MFPPAQPIPGDQLCVRCERALSEVAASEADVARAVRLEKSRPCKAFLQLLGNVPSGLSFEKPKLPKPDDIEDLETKAMDDQPNNDINTYQPASFFSFKRLRRLIASGPVCLFPKAPVVLMSYPEWRVFRAEKLAAPLGSANDDHDIYGDPRV